MEEKTITLDGQEMTINTLQETKNNLKNNERIVEVCDGEFTKVERING